MKPLDRPRAYMVLRRVAGEDVQPGSPYTVTRRAIYLLECGHETERSLVRGKLELPCWACAEAAMEAEVYERARQVRAERVGAQENDGSWGWVGEDGPRVRRAAIAEPVDEDDRDWVEWWAEEFPIDVLYPGTYKCPIRRATGCRRATIWSLVYGRAVCS